MLKRLLLAVVLLVFAFSVTNANPRLTQEQLKKIANAQYTIGFIDDAVYGQKVGTGDYVNLSGLFAKGKDVPVTYDNPTGWIGTVTMIPTGATSIYDMMSNGSTLNIWQDPLTPDKIHIVCVSSPLLDPQPGFPDRKSKYYFSEDRGVTWSFIGNVPDLRSGFPTISGFGDGSALIANHSSDGGTVTQGQAYKDAAAGLGSFTRLSGNPYHVFIWPRVLPTANLTLSNKFIFIGSVNSTAYDSNSYNVCTGMNAPPGTWLGFNHTNGSTAETYAFAIGQDGRIGLLYENADAESPANYGCMWFMESTNSGTSFSAPLKVFNANFSGDSLGGLRGVSLTYQGNVPKGVFETMKQNTAGNYFPGFPNNIRFWSPSLPGADPNKSIIIADTNSVGYHPYIPGATGDVFGPLSRPSIGKSADGNILFVAMAVPSDYVGGPIDTVSFMDVYITASGNLGASWKYPTKITNLNPPTNMMDYTYPSVSAVNDNSGSNYFINMTMYKDAMPGTYVNHVANGESLGSQLFVRIAVPGPVFAHQISTEIPAKYSLSQNYPNPFNPVTRINFAVSKAGFVSLKIYDLTGREIATLVDENLSAGTYTNSFNASALSSGIYFYTLKADNYVETKKMMLVK